MSTFMDRAHGSKSDISRSSLKKQKRRMRMEDSSIEEALRRKSLARQMKSDCERDSFRAAGQHEWGAVGGDDDEDDDDDDAEDEDGDAVPDNDAWGAAAAAISPVAAALSSQYDAKTLLLAAELASKAAQRAAPQSVAPQSVASTSQSAASQSFAPASQSVAPRVAPQSVASQSQSAASLRSTPMDANDTAFLFAVQVLGGNEHVDVSASGPRIKRDRWLELPQAQRDEFKRLLARDRELHGITEDDFIVNKLPARGSRQERRLRKAPDFSNFLLPTTSCFLFSDFLLPTIRQEAGFP